MDLVALLRTLRQEWLPAVLALVAVLAGSFYFAITPEDKFQASASILVTPNLSNPNIGVVGGGSAVDLLLPVLEVTATTPVISDRAISRLSEEVANAPWSVSARVDQTRPILFVTARSTDATVVAPVAQAYADVIRANPPADFTELVRLQVITRAAQPLEPYAPNRASVMISGGVLALLAMVGAALLSRSLRRPHRLADDIQRKLRRTVLGEIPPSRRLQKLLRPTQLFDGSDPAGVEPYMRLRANLEIQLASRGPASITVTSRSQNEGKSTVAALLGWALASAGHRVTLVDGDLRRPTLTRYLGVEGRSSESGDSELPVVPTALPLLSLVNAHALRRIAAGDSHAPVGERHPSEVLLSGLPTVLAATSTAKHLVLVDAPPVLGAAEALLSCALTQAVIVIVDARRRTALEDLEQVLYQIEEADGEVLGIVLNRARLGRHANRQLTRYAVSGPSAEPPEPRHAITRPHPAPPPEAAPEAAPEPREPAQRPASWDAPATPWWEDEPEPVRIPAADPEPGWRRSTDEPGTSGPIPLRPAGAGASSAVRIVPPLTPRGDEEEQPGRALPDHPA